MISMAVPKTFEMRLDIHMEQEHRELCVRNRMDCAFIFPYKLHLFPCRKERSIITVVT